MKDHRAFSLRTAFLIYALLVIAALLTLHDKPLYITLILIGGIAVKTWLSHVRDRQE